MTGRVNVRCHVCGKWRSALEFVKLDLGGQNLCYECIDWQNDAIREYGERAAEQMAKDGGIRCDGCHRLRTEIPGASDIPMNLHKRDGVLQGLCDECHREYSTKRRDRYEGTRFWKELQARI